MITDALLQFSGTVVGNTVTGQSLVGAAQTVTSTNVVDLAGVGAGNVARDLGQGGGLDIENAVTSAFNGGSLQAVLVTADDAAISVNVTQVVLTPFIQAAALPAGTLIPLHLDRAAPLVPRRYMAIQYTTLGTVLAGAVTATIVRDVQDKGNSTIFASGFTVA
jgi:hypothetical protein